MPWTWEVNLGGAGLGLLYTRSILRPFVGATFTVMASITNNLCWLHRMGDILPGMSGPTSAVLGHFPSSW